jgi:hypothetical protein
MMWTIRAVREPVAMHRKDAIGSLGENKSKRTVLQSMGFVPATTNAAGAGLAMDF